MLIRTLAYPIFALCVISIPDILTHTARSEDAETVVASQFGYDPIDATDALQRAINSGAATVVVDKQEGPWIVRPIALRSDLELVFKSGVEVIAKQGEFHAKNDCLFSAVNIENVTLRGEEGEYAILRMRKSDYHSEQYEASEWRHGVSIKSCTDVHIEGLSIIESGGDGIYLGTATRGRTNKNVVIRNVLCDRNNRQGISVITAEDLLIENVVMSNTGGTAGPARTFGQTGLARKGVL